MQKNKIKKNKEEASLNIAHRINGYLQLCQMQHEKMVSILNRKIKKKKIEDENGFIDEFNDHSGSLHDYIKLSQAFIGRILTLLENKIK